MPHARARSKEILGEVGEMRDRVVGCPGLAPSSGPARVFLCARPRADRRVGRFLGSPIDHAIVAVYTTLDDSLEVWDLIPMMEFLLENAAAPNRVNGALKLTRVD